MAKLAEQAERYDEMVSFGFIVEMVWRGGGAAGEAPSVGVVALREDAIEEPPGSLRQRMRGPPNLSIVALNLGSACLEGTVRARSAARGPPRDAPLVICSPHAPAVPCCAGHRDEEGGHDGSGPGAVRGGA